MIQNLHATGKRKPAKSFFIHLNRPNHPLGSKHICSVLPDLSSACFICIWVCAAKFQDQGGLGAGMWSPGSQSCFNIPVGSDLHQRGFDYSPSALLMWVAANLLNWERCTLTWPSFFFYHCVCLCHIIRLVASCILFYFLAVLMFCICKVNSH